MVASAIIGGVAAGTALMGSIFGSGLFDEDYDVDPSEVQGLFGKTAMDDPYGHEAMAAAGRVTGIRNPYAEGALWEQEWMRQQQQKYLDDLVAQASGQRSFAREQGEATGQRMQGAIRGAGRGQGSRFDTGRRGESMHQAAFVPQQLSSDIQAAEIAEQNNAQRMLSQLYTQRGEADRAALAGWDAQQNLEHGQGIAASQLGMQHAGLGSALKRRQLAESVQEQQNKSTAEAND